MPQNRAKSVAEIAPESLKPEQGPAIATLVLHPLNAAKTAPSGQTSFFPCHAGENVVLFGLLEMSRYLVVELTLKLTPLKRT